MQVGIKREREGRGQERALWQKRSGEGRKGETAGGGREGGRRAGW